MGRIRLRPDAIAQLKKHIEASISEVISDLDLEYEKVIEDENAFAEAGFEDWDMVDTGRFRDSQQVEVITSTGIVRASWVWNPSSSEDGYHYAAALYYGFYAFGDKNRWIPGRRWVERGIQRINPVQSLTLKLQEKGIPAQVRRNNISAIGLE